MTSRSTINPIARRIHPSLLLVLLLMQGFPYWCSGAEDPFALLRDAYHLTSHTPFHGEMIYTRWTREGQSAAAFSVYLASPTLMRIEFSTPEVVKGNIMTRNEEGVWATSLREEQRGKVREEMELYPWYRILRRREPLFFQHEIEWASTDLFLKNYQVSRHESPPRFGRETFAIQVDPKERGRPALRLVFDAATRVQLESTRLGFRGEPFESYSFQSFHPGGDGSEALYNTNGLKRIFSFQESGSPPPAVALNFKPFIVTCLPEGFEKMSENIWKGRSGITQRIVYTDGFARLSIYQRTLNDEEKEKLKQEEETQKPKERIVKRLVQRGSTIFFRDIQGMRISAVGDLHPKAIIDTLAKMKQEE